MAQTNSGPPAGPQGDALVVFGITGDLAKKMTLKALYDLCENGTLKVPVIGVGRTDWSDDDLRQHAREVIEARIEAKGSTARSTRTSSRSSRTRLSYVQGDYNDFDTYGR